jgi:hypothetical protein
VGCSFEVTARAAHGRTTSVQEAGMEKALLVGASVFEAK